MTGVPSPSDPSAEAIRSALAAGDLHRARSLIFHWLSRFTQSLPTYPIRTQLRQPELWSNLADVVERTSDHHLLELFWQAMDGVRPAPLPPGAPLPLLGLPILNRPDLLERLLASLDHPVETLAIVDNSPGSAAEAAVHRTLSTLQTNGHPRINRIVVARGFGNAGVAASWNQILRAFPTASVALLVNNDVQLADGVLAAALGQIQADQSQFLPLLPAPQEFSAFLITALCWNRIGLFDPGFHPAYCEDLDYRDRLHREQSVQWLHSPELQQTMAACNPESSCTITSDPELAERNRCSFALNRLWWLSHRRLRDDPRGTWLRQWLTEWKG